MSIIASYDFNDSTAQYKRFASLAVNYVDNPAMAKAPIAQIPLENFYRLLEMFRYDAFSDEPHCGVLELDAHNEDEAGSRTGWESQIVGALNAAVNGTFASKNEAINEMEEVLRQLVRNASLDEPRQAPAKQFLSRFITALD